MKKIIILLLALTLVLGVFVSCNKRYLYIDDETSSSPIESIYETTSEETSNEKTSESTSEETNEPPKTSDTAVTVDTIESIDGTEGGTTEIPEVEDPSEYNYTVEKIDGEYYLVFNDYFKVESIDQVYSPFIVPSLDFLKHIVPSGNMDRGSKNCVMGYINDNDPDHKVKIYDVEHVWQPIFPDSLPATQSTQIEWHMTSYVFNGWLEDRPAWLESMPSYMASVYLEKTYKKAYESDQEKLISQGYSKKEFYDGDKELVAFCFSIEDPEEAGAYRYYYSIYITNGQYYGIIDINLAYELTDDELLEFGFEEY
ncbi:MAG: hypothetical protein IKL59_06245 [Clostridia bacterium]|nr:hypothetical protein [Clostridia bacterium]